MTKRAGISAKWFIQYLGITDPSNSSEKTP